MLKSGINCPSVYRNCQASRHKVAATMAADIEKKIAEFRQDFIKSLEKDKTGFLAYLG